MGNRSGKEPYMDDEVYYGEIAKSNTSKGRRLRHWMKKRFRHRKDREGSDDDKTDSVVACPPDVPVDVSLSRLLRSLDLDDDERPDSLCSYLHMHMGVDRILNPRPRGNTDTVSDEFDYFHPYVDMDTLDGIRPTQRRTLPHGIDFLCTDFIDDDSDDDDDENVDDDLVTQMSAVFDSLDISVIRRVVARASRGGPCSPDRAADALLALMHDSLDKLWRAKLRDCMGTYNLVVDRNNLMQATLDAYASVDPRYLKHKPHVKFVGEAGEDAGALSKEFFHLSLQMMLTEILEDGGPIFEGAPDHLLPCACRVHVDNGVYFVFGSLLAHSLLHHKLGVSGMSPVLKYVLSHDVNLDSPTDPSIPVDIEDIANISLRETIEKLRLEPGDLTEADRCELRSAMDESGYGVTPFTPTNCARIRQHLLLYHTITKRKGPIAAIRRGMDAVNLFQFLCQYPSDDNIQAALPALADVRLAPYMLRRAIRGQGGAVSRDQLAYLHKFIEELHLAQHGSHTLESLVVFWTGGPAVPSRLEVVMHKDDPYPTAHACFNQLCLPAACNSYTHFVEKFLVALDYGAVGYGLS